VSAAGERLGQPYRYCSHDYDNTFRLNRFAYRDWIKSPQEVAKDMLLRYLRYAAKREFRSPDVDVLSCGVS
jgi:hypothetical protein